MAPGLAEMFSAAVKQLVKKEGRGGQKGLAGRLCIKKAHLSNALAGPDGKDMSCEKAYLKKNPFC